MTQSIKIRSLATRLCVASILFLSAVCATATTTPTTPTPPSPQASKPLADELVASHGAQWIKKIPKDVINTPKPKRFSEAAKLAEAEASARGIEEIRVIGELDPEDISPSKRPPMLAFRQRLEKDKPMTPWQKTQIALCFIGLCSASYGPEGVPIEDKSTTRAERNKDKSSLQQSQQFRGTFQ